MVAESTCPDSLSDSYAQLTAEVEAEVAWCLLGRAGLDVSFPLPFRKDSPQQVIASLSHRLSVIARSVCVDIHISCKVRIIFYWRVESYNV